MNLDSIITPISEIVTASTAAISAYLYFHQSYYIRADFDRNYKTNSLDYVQVNCINNSKTPQLVKFDGIIPNKQFVNYYNFKNRIRSADHEIKYDYGDNNYNSVYMKYFHQLIRINSHDSTDNIKIPLSDIIMISNLDDSWHRLVTNELNDNNPITFMILFENAKRKPISKTVKITPYGSKFMQNTYREIKARLLK